MQLRCPHCRAPVELSTVSSFDAVECAACGSRFNLTGDKTTSTEALELRTIDHFQLFEQLGAGHFGSVWKARDTELDRWVAIKLPRKAELTENEKAYFLREAQSAAQLRHPHIVTVYEAGNYDGTDFGLARREELDVTVTVNGQVIRTSAYISPEQAKGNPGHGRTGPPNCGPRCRARR